MSVRVSIASSRKGRLPLPSRQTVAPWHPIAIHGASAPWHFLYFLPLPHGHGIVASDLRLVALDLLDDVVAAGSRRARRRRGRRPRLPPPMAPNGDGGGADCGAFSVTAAAARRGGGRANRRGVPAPRRSRPA